MTEQMEFRSSRNIYYADPDKDRLGGGQTAQVYRVTADDRRYALKLLSDPAYEQRFFQEVDFLIDFFGASAYYGLELNDRRLVPQVYDQQRKGERRFFVMDLAAGQPLDEILRAAPGYLDEVDALTLAEQLCRVFHCLHDELRRSYLDFQPKNVFWDGEARQIMVIDWNLLSDKGKADVPTDLYALGRLLYRMVVGIDVPRRGLGESPRWEEVSLGTRLILRKALHRNREQRFATADELRQAILPHLQRWSLSPDQLVQEAGKSNNAYKTAADNGEKRQRLEQAAVELDLADRKPEALSEFLADRVYPSLKAEVETAYDHTKPLEEGKEQIRLGKGFASAIDYQKAADHFRRAMEEAPDFSLQLEAARWYLLAQAGSQGSESFSKHQETYLKALSLMQSQDYAQVVDLITPDVERAGGPGIVKLKHEAQAWLTLEEARREGERVQRENAIDVERWQAVSDLYSQVLVLTGDLEYRDLLLEEWGDVAGERAPFEKRAVALRASAQALAGLQALLEEAPAEAIEAIDRHLSNDPGNPVLLSMCAGAAQDWLGAGRDVAAASQAQHLLDVALRWAGSYDRSDLERLWQKAEAVIQADQTLAQAKTAFGRIPRDLMAYSASMVAALGWSHKIGDTAAVERTIRQDFHQATIERDLPAAEVIARIAEKLPALSFAHDVDALQAAIEQSQDGYGAWLRDQIGQLADPDLDAWRARLQEDVPLAAMVETYMEEVQSERLRRNQVDALTATWRQLNQQLSSPTVDLAALRRLDVAYTELLVKAQAPELLAADLVANIQQDQEQLRLRIEALDAQEKAAIEAQALEAQAKKQKETDMAPLLAIWTAAELLRHRPEQQETRVGLLRALIEQSKQAPYPSYSQALDLRKQSEQALQTLGVPVVPPPPVAPASQTEQKPAPVASGPAELDPQVEKRLRRNSWVAGLVSAAAAVALLLLGGWGLSRALAPSESDLQLTATVQARGISTVVAVAFTDQQQAASETQAANARLTAIALEQATQTVVAAETQAAQQTASAVAAEQAAVAAEQAAAAQAVAAAQTAEAAPAATATAAAVETAAAIAAKTTGEFSIIWPTSGLSMAVAPWDLVAQSNGDAWPLGAYSLLLDNVPIYQFPTPVQGQPLDYTRAITDFFDRFPDLSPEARTALGLQANDDLAAGPHELRVGVDQNADSVADMLSAPANFVIAPETRVAAIVQGVPEPGLARLEFPNASEGTFAGQGIKSGNAVALLGKATIADANGQPVTWYLWEAEAVAGGQPTRRGWSLSTYFRPDQGQTLDAVPDIAIPPAAG